MAGSAGDASPGWLGTLAQKPDDQAGGSLATSTRPGSTLIGPGNLTFRHAGSASRTSGGAR
eukprot:6240329-Alexandrium_andersonii.AAC.1